MVYKEVDKAMFAQKMTFRELFEKADLNYSTMLPKISGRKTPHSTGEITLAQAVKIKRALNLDKPLEEIFVEAIVQ